MEVLKTAPAAFQKHHILINLKRSVGGLAFAYTQGMQMEAFQSACVRALAAAAGINVREGEKHDTYKTDMSFSFTMGESDRLVEVKAQLKSTSNLKAIGEGKFAYDLDVTTYDLLRNANQSNAPIILIVMEIPNGTSPWTHTNHDRTRVERRNFFIPLYGHRPATGKTSARVLFGPEHLLSATNLRTNLENAVSAFDRLTQGA